MRAVLRCDLTVDGHPWDISLLETDIAGLTLLRRHLLGLQQAGCETVRLVAERDRHPSLHGILERTPIDGIAVEVAEQAYLEGCSEAYLEQRADTLFDPRLQRQLASLSRLDQASETTVHPSVCLDRFPDEYPYEDKSPYQVGAPDRHEMRPAEESDGALYEIGVGVVAPDSPAAPLRLFVGRYYWQRIHRPEHASPAKRKILLATMKPTDNLYARANRRVSLVISGFLVHTPVTPNMVTGFAFFGSLASGLLYAVGSYPAMVAGAFVS